MINKDIKIIILVGVLITTIASIICLFINPICAVICLILGITIITIFTICTKKRIEKINELNNYLSLVCAGKFDLDIPDNSEGELSILKNNLYKVITLLRTQNELLIKDKTYLADSLADISHQLKTPLTSMMVMTDLLKDESQSQNRDKFLSIIETQLNKMKWLITNLLKLSKLDAGTAEFKKEPFSIKSVIEQSLKPFLITFDLKNIRLINNAENFSVNGDESWTVEAFENIIKNCTEHMGTNSTLEINTKINSVYDSIFIADNGCGIAEDDLPHIFERFYHGKNSSKDSVGIGLALAKTIFDKEKAVISVKSEENKGTEFEIRFYKSIV